MDADIEFMQEALRLAAQGRYTTFPNPQVGALIVKNQAIIGRGFHQRAGEAHAEIFALQEAGEAARGATLYINLEPCCHYGRTPPCTEALIKAGIRRVVIAMQDPNSLVSGKGIKVLKEAGIEIELGLLEAEAKDLNRAFVHYIQYKRPYVLAKWAISLDGQMRTAKQDDRQLSDSESQKEVHELRHSFQALLIGSQTAALDNPALTVRYAETLQRQPQRIVLNTRADLDSQLRLFNGSLPDKTYLLCGEAYEKRAKKRYSPETTEILSLPLKENAIDLEALLILLGKKEIMSLLVEGGAQVLNSFFKAGLVNEALVYVTPWFVGDLPHKLPLSALVSQQSGKDIKITTRLY